jgi:hypothetical protein
VGRTRQDEVGDINAHFPKYPRQGSNFSPKSSTKPHILQAGGTESGTLSGDSGFADAVAAVMRLPLTDAEKAEAVRRLLADLACSKSRAPGE